MPSSATPQSLASSVPPLSIGKYPRAILHIDGDAFFASCEQSRDPSLMGKPVITGKERGIAASLSYEAKVMGITRGMSLREIKKVCPQAIIMPSDYETYSILSKRFYEIVRRYTPDVEEYGIDECFADITGLRRVHRCSYETIAGKIKHDLDSELGFTFSAGLAPNKVVAKIGSKWKKPSGLTSIQARNIHLFLGQLDVSDIWGIGQQTSAFLYKHKIRTALDFAHTDEQWVRKWTAKPYYEIWQELNGRCLLELNIEEKTSYQSISKVKTFTPPSTDKDFVYAQLARNIEAACMKARRYDQEPQEVSFFLKSQTFHSRGVRVKLSRATAFPHEVIRAITPAFEEIYEHGVQYRATGVHLSKLTTIEERQMDLFGVHVHAEKMQSLYGAMDKMRTKYGKNTLYLGSSHEAHKAQQHDGERGHETRRKQNLLPGETKRRRLAVPMFLGDVV